MHQISVQDLAEWLGDEQRPAPVLLDVREPWEHELGHVEGTLLMPMHTVPLRMKELQADLPIVCICHHGGRSMQVAAFLEGRGFSTVYNLTGGMDHWSQLVDPSIKRY
jgi:rhodanese-related sulfurtransferase